MHPSLDRIFIGIMSFGYLAASIFLVFLAVGWTSPFYVVQNYLLFSTNRWIMGITGAILFLVSLTLFISSFRSKPVKVAVIHETSLGNIKITLPALENLVVKAARSVQGVREVKTFLKAMHDTVSVQLKVQVFPDINIPQVTEELQKKVQEYLNKTTGINVHDVRVIVSKINWEMKSRVE